MYADYATSPVPGIIPSIFEEYHLNIHASSVTQRRQHVLCDICLLAPLLQINNSPICKPSFRIGLQSIATYTLTWMKNCSYLAQFLLWDSLLLFGLFILYMTYNNFITFTVSLSPRRYHFTGINLPTVSFIHNLYTERMNNSVYFSKFLLKAVLLIHKLICLHYRRT